MKKPLLEIVFMSEKRKGVLLLLQDGAKEMEFLLKSLNTTRPALLPQMKIGRMVNLITIILHAPIQKPLNVGEIYLTTT
jgi:predicted transcriptional regulator